MNIAAERCPCGQNIVDMCLSVSSTVSKPLRLANNAGSPAQLVHNKMMSNILSHTDAKSYCIYINPNDGNSPEPAVKNLRKVISKRENVPESSLIFWAGGYSMLNILQAGKRPQSSLIISGDFPGYKNTARHGFKVYESEATMESLINQAEIIKPDIVLFTDGETNPSLTPIDSKKLVHDLRKVNPDGLIVVDQAYGRSAGDCLEVNKLALEHENTIFLRCASKDAGTVGVRLAWTVTKPGGRAEQLLSGLLSPFDIGLDIATKATALYEHPEVLDKASNLQTAAREWIASQLRNDGIEFKSGLSPWILFRPRMDAERAVDLLKRNEIYVQLQTGLHPKLEGFIRVSTTLCEEMQLFYKEAKRLKII